MLRNGEGRENEITRKRKGRRGQEKKGTCFHIHCIKVFSKAALIDGKVRGAKK